MLAPFVRQPIDARLEYFYNKVQERRLEMDNCECVCGQKWFL